MSCKCFLRVVFTDTVQIVTGARRHTFVESAISEVSLWLSTLCEMKQCRVPSAVKLNLNAPSDAQYHKPLGFP